MATIDISGAFRERPVGHDLLGTLRAGWQTFLRRREERRTLVTVSRLPPHVIRDMGLDPERVHGKLAGSWDDVHPVTFRILLPRDAHI